MAKSIDRLLGKKVFVRYVDYMTYLNTGCKPFYSLNAIKTKKVTGILDNHSEPMFYIDGGDEEGYVIIPRQFIVEMYELIEKK